METMSRKVKETTSSAEVARKQRTREHVIVDLSLHHVEGFVLRCGYTVQRTVADYGYDLYLETYSETGEIEADPIRLQLKASDNLQQYELTEEEVFSFPVSTKDYRLWSEALLPVFLILYDATVNEGYWLDVQDYAANQPQDLTGKSLRLRIPRRHVLGVQTIRLIRQRKQQRIQNFRRLQKGS
jgi:Domain of unknown function (DUF4365)